MTPEMPICIDNLSQRERNPSFNIKTKKNFDMFKIVFLSWIICLNLYLLTMLFRPMNVSVCQIQKSSWIVYANFQNLFNILFFQALYFSLPSRKYKTQSYFVIFAIFKMQLASNYKRPKKILKHKNINITRNLEIRQLKDSLT